MKMWSGRFTAETDKAVEIFNASIFFDKELFLEDLVGSAAHVRMLNRSKIISTHDTQTILQGLRHVLESFNDSSISYSAADEDIHMLVERLLTQKIGPVAGKLHTARSRNDQVALDMHLYFRRQSVEIVELLQNLQQSLLTKAELERSTILPGYTHLQRAQPVRFSHHLLAYVAMFARDIERFQDLVKRINKLPLGSGAIAGTTFPIDRLYVARLLHFAGVYENSMDGVSNRDYLLDFLHAASTLMMHLSRLSEELILWTSTEFGFVELHDSFCTGSSMMPQKKNPDVAELVRGKSGRVFGSLMSLLTTLKGLPLTYNKDMQEDKEGAFDTLRTIKACLNLYAPMIDTMTVRRDRMRSAAMSDFSNATDLADYLVRKGLPFREAHEVAGKCVLYCMENGIYLLDADIDTLRKISPLIESDIFADLAIEQVVDRRTSQGGTGEASVAHQLKRAQEELVAIQTWLADHNRFRSYDIDSLFLIEEI
jgi:argininosuccinate lyase